MMPSSRWQEARNSSREIFSSSLWSIFCRKTDYNKFIFHDILHAFNNNEIKMETENVPWIKDPLCLWCATLLGILLCPSAHGRQWSHQSFPVLWWNHLEIIFFVKCWRDLWNISWIQFKIKSVIYNTRWKNNHPYHYWYHTAGTSTSVYHQECLFAGSTGWWWIPFWLKNSKIIFCDDKSKILWTSCSLGKSRTWRSSIYFSSVTWKYIPKFWTHVTGAF